MNPIRTQGIYEIYAREDGSPFHLSTDRLDTSLSLGTGKPGTNTWKPGRRKDGRTCEIQIDTYAACWNDKVNPPHPMILVLGEDAGHGAYRPTLTVIDGAMWVAAAKNAGRDRVPVYVVVPVDNAKVEPEAMWLYFNTVSNGLAVTDKERNDVLHLLAQAAKNRGITDAYITVNDERVRAYVDWAKNESRVVGLPESVIVEVTKAQFATQRSKAQIERDRQALKSGKKNASQVAKDTGKSTTAIRRDMKRQGIQAPSTRGKNGTGTSEPKPTRQDRIAKAKEAFKAPMNGQVTSVVQQVAKAVSELAPVLDEIITNVEKLTNEPSVTKGSVAQHFSLDEMLTVWSQGFESLAAEMLRLADQGQVYADLNMAKRDGARIISLARTVFDTLRRHDDPLFEVLYRALTSGEPEQVALAV